MKHYKWVKGLPKFTEECIIIIAIWHSRPGNEHWEYTLYTIEKLDGYNDKDEPCWYWGVVCSDGCEWGDVNELWANKAYTMPLLKKQKSIQAQTATTSKQAPPP